MLMGIATPAISFAAIEKPAASTPAKDKDAEIQAMDKGNLSASEKKVLRKELKQMKATTAA